MEAKWEIEYEDVFHFKNLYKLIHDFINENEWKDPVDDGENYERYYYEKELPRGSKEYRIWWRVIHVPRRNPYIRYVLKLDYLGLNMQKVETVVDGVKYKTWKGDLILYCEGWLQMDYQNKWENSKFLKPFHPFFMNRIYKPYYEFHKKELREKCYDLNREIKRFLQLKTPFKEPKLYREEKGAPV